jgi:hypothetical protein
MAKVPVLVWVVLFKTLAFQLNQGPILKRIVMQVRHFSVYTSLSVLMPHELLCNHAYGPQNAVCQGIVQNCSVTFLIFTGIAGKTNQLGSVLSSLNNDSPHGFPNS